MNADSCRLSETTEIPKRFAQARAKSLSVEILCISCAGFHVCRVIFPLLHAPAFVDNRASSVL